MSIWQIVGIKPTSEFPKHQILQRRIECIESVKRHGLLILECVEEESGSASDDGDTFAMVAQCKQPLRSGAIAQIGKPTRGGKMTPSRHIVPHKVDLTLTTSVICFIRNVNQLALLDSIGPYCDSKTLSKLKAMSGQPIMAAIVCPSTCQNMSTSNNCEISHTNTYKKLYVHSSAQSIKKYHQLTDERLSS